MTMDLTALKTFNGTKQEGLVKAGQKLTDVETGRAKDLVRLGLASQYEVKPAEPETKAAEDTKAKADTASKSAKAPAKK
ncbi:hypothetical protein [Vreelandella nanhaiensis]|uniref:Uncharacterized protein n=1 Tax=Vreelandella nanhaiensis TaxID=1258546 RepID=A0A3S1DUK3_9GAMM|nr:hypothetical protein [Halomonas nanhaiensis]RUR34482.1 hypothetical protein ELY38_02510 [Halomonas nanhaiensis]